MKLLRTIRFDGTDERFRTATAPREKNRAQAWDISPLQPTHRVGGERGKGQGG